MKLGEEETLAAEKERFRHSEKIATAVAAAHRAISANDDSETVLSRVKEAADALRSLAAFGENYANLAQRCDSAYYELEEIGYELADLTEKGSSTPFGRRKLRHGWI